ncbi:MAG: hypothetical protein WCD70_10250 [Alphaproteobacteria bacterium]
MTNPDKIKAMIDSAVAEAATKDNQAQLEREARAKSVHALLNQAREHAQPLLDDLAVIQAQSNGGLRFRPHDDTVSTGTAPNLTIDVIGIGIRYVDGHYRADLVPHFIVKPDGEITFCGTSNRTSKVESVDAAVQLIIGLAAEKRLFPQGAPTLKK